MKKDVLQLDVSELQRRLKDFFFPHIEVYIVIFFVFNIASPTQVYDICNIVIHNFHKCLVISGKQALGYQSSCGLHTKAITMMVMGLDLANLKEGHMAVIKSLSSNRKPLVIHLQLTDSAGAHKS